jgi:hypothetical protein
MFSCTGKRESSELLEDTIKTGNHDSCSPEEPPWKNIFSWDEANQTVAFLIKRHGNNIHETNRFAREIYRKMVSLFPLMENLCMATCTHCPEPCCFSAYAWFDLKDLLFAHLNTLPIPPHQLMTGPKMICRYLGVKGCTLARISRPWICTWYLCPTQLGALRANTRGKKDFFLQAAKETGLARKEMEASFIRETSFIKDNNRKM